MSFRRADAALARHGSVARTRDLAHAGVTKRELTRAVAAGEVRRIRQGVYALPDTPDALVHAAEHGGGPACTTAARLHGLWVLEVRDRAPSFHVWLGRRGDAHGCTRAGCASSLRIHWDAGTALVGRLPPVENVLLQVALCEGEEAFFVALESALRQSLLPAPRLRWLGARLPRPLRWLLAFARADADSGLESLVRLRLHKEGIAVRTQVLIDGVGEVDFLLDDRIIVEADGRANHDDAVGTPAATSKRHKDLRRDARAAARGYETLRFDYALIVHEWPTVLAAIVARLER
ncbi:type IV toxin-antitoxin system AbiEi family antitoxin domain-containing protein [Microbacterium sp. 179-I 3D2 NHS]|uniref:type IV toxin-antitoxin system AbiEi family antitoxin domain-containing protein n=1 Tax=Microbacterium sp. 179-I 3D2 NHS TaxID=3235178 RepID=UPI0039A31F45